MRLRHYFVYIMANNRPTLYVGVTNDLGRRYVEHRYKFIEGFTKKYGLTKLIYYEVFTDIQEAIKREKQLKRWNRTWKLTLIRQMNPTFTDLYDKIIEGGSSGQARG